MKVIIDNFIEQEEKSVEQLTFQYGDKRIPKDILMYNIEYHKSLVVILDVFKLLCFYFADEIDYIHIDKPEIVSLIKETKQRIIEKGSDA